MKTKYFGGIIAYPLKDGITFKIDRVVKNSQPFKIEERFYHYKYNSDHIFLAIARFLIAQKILWGRNVGIYRSLNKDLKENG